jgi:transposase
MPIMETVGKKKPRHRRSFTPEFKAEIVDACNRGDRSIGQLARDFDLTETAVREWVKQADIDAGRRDGLTSAEREELTQLRRENRQLREDVGILRRAAAFFAFMSPSTRVVVGDATIRVPGGLARFFGARRCRAFPRCAAHQARVTGRRGLIGAWPKPR